MIVWTGAGIVVPFIWLATLVLVFWSANSIAFLKHLGTWLFSIQHLIAGVLCFWFSLVLKKQKARVVIDKETKQEITLKSSHTLFLFQFSTGAMYFLA